ncbi:hypothetical protein BT96DRAFT_1098197 [Gymnopus androsaceus JB14]|uniref:Protein kinase domain-containing protein n=1 Tax=Gymnopus androsaceus JB14 TaxID=1447944 RepID=A0A6A4HSH0_9AGAR|nr:hypothetical protein BT96DRAFT_1098197 [Gymnopus androsaceus JB14]
MFYIFGRGGTETEMRQIPLTVPIYRATGKNLPPTVQAYLAAQARAQAEAQARMPNRRRFAPASPVVSNDDAGAGTTGSGIGNGRAAPVIPGPLPASYGVTRTNSGSRRLHSHKTSSGMDSGEVRAMGNVGQTSSKSMREKFIHPGPGAIPAAAAPAISQQPLGPFNQFTQRLHRRNSNSNPAPHPPAPVIPHDYSRTHSHTHSHSIPRLTLAIIPPPLFVPPPPTEHRVRHQVSFINPNQCQHLNMHPLFATTSAYDCIISAGVRDPTAVVPPILYDVNLPPSPISVHCKPNDSAPTSKSKTDAIPADILSEPALTSTLMLDCYCLLLSIYAAPLEPRIKRRPTLPPSLSKKYYKSVQFTEKDNQAFTTHLSGITLDKQIIQGQQNNGVWVLGGQYKAHDKTYQGSSLILKVVTGDVKDTAEIREKKAKAEVKVLDEIEDLVASGMFSHKAFNNNEKPVPVISTYSNVPVGNLWTTWQAGQASQSILGSAYKDTKDQEAKQKMQTTTIEMMCRKAAQITVAKKIYHNDNHKKNILVTASVGKVHSIEIIDWGFPDVYLVTDPMTEDEIYKICVDYWTFYWKVDPDLKL